MVAGPGGGFYRGLDNPAVESALNLLGIRGRKKRRRIFEGLRVMEDAALPVLNDQDV